MNAEKDKIPSEWEEFFKSVRAQNVGDKVYIPEGDIYLDMRELKNISCKKFKRKYIRDLYKKYNKYNFKDFVVSVLLSVIVSVIIAYCMCIT